MVKMPFDKKPSTPKVDIDKLIDKGAPEKECSKVEDDSREWCNINLRIPIDMLKAIDAAVKQTVGIKRTGWILLAIQKELKLLQEKKNET